MIIPWRKGIINNNNNYILNGYLIFKEVKIYNGSSPMDEIIMIARYFKLFFDRILECTQRKERYSFLKC